MGKFLYLPNSYIRNREKSFRFNYRWTVNSNFPQAKILLELCEEIFEMINIQGKNYRKEDKKTALICIIINLLASISSGKEVAFPRKSIEYSYPESYGMTHYTRTNILGIIDALTDLGYVEQRPGYFNYFVGSGKVTRMWATEKFIKLIDEKFGSLYEIFGRKNYNREEALIRMLRNGIIKKIDFKYPIHLKDEKKRQVELKMSPKIRKMLNFLFDYNNLLLSHSITISESVFATKSTSNQLYTTIYQTPEPDTDYLYSNIQILPLREQDFTKPLNYIEVNQVDLKLDCRVHRVFNNSRFDNGGRYYGSDVHLFKEKERKELKIDGRRVVEIDYVALHIMMLYHHLGIDYQDDPYKVVSSVEYMRTPIKRMMQMMINAKTYYRAEGAFKKWLIDEPEYIDLLYQDDIDGKQLMEMISNSHPKISEYFYSGIGTELQFKDSCIAENIMKYFMKNSEACLPVHDSFIVDIKYKDELLGVMQEEYKKVMGFKGRVKVN